MARLNITENDKKWDKAGYSESYHRGHEVYTADNGTHWYYKDNNELAEVNTTENSKIYDRPCKRCGKMPTREGYDYCLGKIENVDSACCGHGVYRGYVVLRSGKYIRLPRGILKKKV